MKREHLGIYMGNSHISAFATYSRPENFNKDSFKEIPIRSESPGVDALKALLSAITPSKKRRISIVLPRDQVFVREVTFENLSLSEAKNSVKMSMDLHCHLPEDQIFFDIMAYQRGEKIVVTIFYVPKDRLDPLLDTIKKAGHRKSLTSIVPTSIAWDSVQREWKKEIFPHAYLFQDDTEYVLSLHGQGHWEGSYRIKRDTYETALEEVERLRELLPVPWNSEAKVPTLLGPGGIGDNKRKTHPLCQSIKEAVGSHEPWRQHAAIAALTASTFPPISLHGPRRRPIRLKMNLFHTALAASIAAMIALSIPVYKDYTHTTQSLLELEGRLSETQKVLTPIEEKVKKAQKIKEELDTLKAFSYSTPPILDILDEIARLTPEEAWIKTFNMTDSTIRMSAEGPNAVSIMSSWRKSPYFEEVRLVSPVTKARGGNERFSVEIRLKKGQ